jgi:hypothetical protein
MGMVGGPAPGTAQLTTARSRSSGGAGLDPPFWNCGFANFASLGIIIGERRDEVAALRFKLTLSGTLSTCLMGALVGVIAWTKPLWPGWSAALFGTAPQSFAAPPHCAIGRAFARPRWLHPEYSSCLYQPASSTVLNSAGRITSSNSQLSE